MTARLRPATRTDAADLVVLVDTAAHGLALWLWQQRVASGEFQSALEAGRMRARRDEGAFSWRNATIAEIDGEIAGMLVGFREPDEPEAIDFSEIEAPLRPLIEMEAEVPGSWYVNVLAAHPEFRGQGVGKVLLGHAEGRAAETGADAVTLIVEDANAGARRFYEREGFGEAARRPYVPFPGGPKATEWLLMVKPLTNERD